MNRSAEHEDGLEAGREVCPRCGTERSGEGRGSLCPACLVAGALTPGVAVRSESDDADKPLSRTWMAGFPQLEIGPQVRAGREGEVYLALDACDGAPRRLTVVGREQVKASGGVEGWSQQLGALTRLNHPHLARVLDYGEFGQGFFWIVEAPEGGSLADLLRDGSLSPEEVEAIVQQADDAVASSRAVGVLLALEFRDVMVGADRRATLLPTIRDDEGRSGAEAANMREAETAVASGQSVGPYRIVDKIGEGGFADVWLAEQDEPVKRHVAIKIVKPGMDTRRVLARFEAERQALAMLNHPNIARVLDAGSTNEGRPYFVMEAVDGSSLTEHCERTASPLEERLRLVRVVCEAVQHAHQKGIIHRDLKPSNVLVSEESGEAVPMVIDFGIAKAVEQSLTENTIFTRDHQVLGTPDYMSPEQMASGRRAADSRSDVYSLGVLLFELLTGETPFSFRDSAEGESVGAMKRVLSGRVAPKPSVRRGTRLERESKEDGGRPSPRIDIPRELDWIVLKALESDPERRYRSPAELGDDLRRMLAHEPVLAGPPTRIYQVRKFVRRHRAGVGAAAAVAVALVVGTALAVAGMLQAREERGRAVSAHQEAVEQARLADEARQEAEHQASVAKAVSIFMQDDLLAFANPYNTTDTQEVTLREVVESAAAKVDERFAAQPEVRATLHYSLAGIYNSLSLYEKAETHLRKAVETREECCGEDHPATLEARRFLARVTISTEGHAERLKRLEAVAEDQRRVLGEDHRETLSTERSIASQLIRLGQWEEAEPRLRAIYRRQRELWGEDDEEVLVTMGVLGRALYEHGTPRKEEEGIALARERLERLAEADEVDEMELDVAQHMLGVMLSQAGHPEEAVKLERAVLDRRKRILGESNVITLLAMSNLANTLRELGKHEESIALYRKAVAAYENREGKSPSDELSARYGLANSLQLAGKPKEALAEYERVLEEAPSVFGEGHHRLLSLRMMIADCHEALGDLEEAVRRYRDIVPATREKVGPNHPWTIMRSNNLAVYLGSLGHHQEAEPIWKEVCAAAEACYGADGLEMARYLAGYSWCLFQQEKFAESIPLRKREEEIYEKHLGTADVKTKEARLDWLTSHRMTEEPMSEEEVQEVFRLWREVNEIKRREDHRQAQEEETSGTEDSGD